jgi:hypothetical protein
MPHLDINGTPFQDYGMTFHRRLWRFDDSLHLERNSG